MKLSGLILLFILCANITVTHAEMMLPIDINFISTSLDTTLNDNTSEFSFVVKKHPRIQLPTMVAYKLDQVKYTVELGVDLLISINTTPGKHVFEFYINDDYYYPVNSDTLEILNQHRSNYTIYFRPNRYIPPTNLIMPDPVPVPIINEVCKPVIYLYPEIEIDVEVKIDIKGENTFLYPAYQDSWKCTASPNGDLTIGDDTYNYLFWESSQFDHLQYAANEEGFIIEGMNAISFLEDKLSQAGFTSKEKADFITFWAPLIQKNDLNFVRFEFNETCDKFAELNISPKPDHVFRMYIFFSPIHEKFEVTEQKIERINREGFTVLEWGGQKSIPIQLNEIR